MKNTLRLFQLLLAVFGFYVVVQYTGNSKYIIPLVCIVLIVIMDRFETAIIRNAEAQDMQALHPGGKLDPSEKLRLQVDCIGQGSSLTVVSNTSSGNWEWSLGLVLSIKWLIVCLKYQVSRASLA